MPRVTWANRTDWLNHYRITKPDGSTVTYGDDRTWSGDLIDNEVWRTAGAIKDFMLAHGGTVNDRVLIVGAGMGFTVETLKLLSVPNVFAMDSSTWCNNQKATVNNGIILVNADLNSSVNALKGTFNTATGGRDFAWIVSESVLESYTDGEITAITNQAPQLLTAGKPNANVIHLVFTPPFNTPGQFNEKTMAQWKAMAPTQTWMNFEGYGVA